jgi:exonuclease III
MARNPGTAWPSSPDQEPRETRRGLPGDRDDSHSRYIEAAIDGIVVGCLYLPNGNPAPGPKFDYKLRWFERLHSYAAELFELDVPVALVGDFNVMPTDLYKPERWRDDALFRPEARAAYAELIAMGWMEPSACCIRKSGSIPSGSISGTPSRVMPVCASTIFCLARPCVDG